MSQSSCRANSVGEEKDELNQSSHVIEMKFNVGFMLNCAEALSTKDPRPSQTVH